MEPDFATGKIVLLPTPGLEQFTLVATGPIRGMEVMGEAIFVVGGTGVYLVNAGGASTFLGNIASGGPVSMANNGTQVMIVVPETNQGWIATTSSLTQITDTDFPGATSVTYINGYFVCSTPFSNEFFISELMDGRNWDALDFASKEAAPDYLTAVKRVGQTLWLVGERTSEIWVGATSGDFPFQRSSSGFIEHGTVAPFAIVARESLIFWFGENRVAYMSDGGLPRRISTHAIEQAWAGYGVVFDARAWSYDMDGHQMFVLTFPWAGETWVYDLTTQQWHERESDGYFGTWRPHCGVMFGGGVVGGDSIDGRLYLVRPVSAHETGVQIQRLATGTTLNSEGYYLRHNRFELDMETGVGLLVGQGVDPQVCLQWSDDRGRTFSNEHWQTLGRLGKYQTRMHWSRLGTSRSRTYRLTMADPVMTSIVAANIDVDRAAH